MAFWPAVVNWRPLLGIRLDHNCDLRRDDLIDIIAKHNMETSNGAQNQYFLSNHSRKTKEWQEQQRRVIIELDK